MSSAVSVVHADMYEGMSYVMEQLNVAKCILGVNWVVCIVLWYT